MNRGDSYWRYSVYFRLIDVLSVRDSGVIGFRERIKFEMSSETVSLFYHFNSAFCVDNCSFSGDDWLFDVADNGA